MAFGEQPRYFSAIPHIRFDRDGLAAIGFDIGDDFIRHLPAPRIVDHYFGPFAGKAAGDLRADSFRHARHYSDFTL